MERYLTEKSKSPRWWEMPAMAVSGFFTAIGVWVVATDGNPAEPFIQILAGGLFLLTLSLPLWRTLLRRRRRAKARAIAKCLAECRESTLTLGALERRSGVRRAERTIYRLTEKGFLKNVDMDAAKGVIRLSGFAEAQAAPEAQSAPEAPLPDTGIESFDEKLRQIRDLNDRIDHPEVSRKIERIEALTGDIFQFIAQRPERAADARRFINYYLPTTLKLLESYDLMEDQRYQGESIQASRKQIEAALDKLIQAIERQQDKLFKTDALDVETDIEVLETMMANDGLTDRGLKIGS